MFRSIRAKFIVGFFLIFCIAFVLINQTVSQIIQTSNRNIITEDLIGLKKNSNGFVRQAFLINHFSNNDLYFGQIAEEIASDLHYATSSEVSAYTVDGVLLHSTNPAAFTGATTDDLKQALRGATAYTISYDKGTASVVYAYPVMIDGVKVGILRYAKSFNLLYEQSGRILDAIFYFALAIFAAAFLFSYLLSRHITIPLVKMAKASEEVKNGNLAIRLAIKRRDEIGLLAGNFNAMIGRISSQIERIGRDRDRLESLNSERKQFFDKVTHELKTPLTSILGYAELIRENGESDKAFFHKGMNHIVEESQRLHSMVLSLLEASQDREGWQDRVRVDFSLILRDVCEAMAFKAQRYKKTIALEAGEGLYVLAQPDKLRRLIINLLDNAIKYSFAHSEIRINAVMDDTGIIRLAIVNQGEPIAAEQLARIFEPFFLADGDGKQKEAGSVGLGLSIAQSIVHEIGGNIDMISKNGETAVYVALPYLREEGAPE
ncbi:sensor histidine kinase [Paenibacillus lignilyticus]|uniref:histidine kinase n=1 Tax=Paenibacillus lignilyticus TaxID=1172615 RepID=A0ABS5C6N0_9BACL|nr:HAMP domain-containing sensor histidine kinase [Paenibacillus lignilyticus]MBP3961615.1 HAMP domain-containing histidine kinase [Paenibacillus lignilyticus]MBP3963715.1 HAMP domain-containing histidine kinase [Paenibacillus lignilyticus]